MVLISYQLAVGRLGDDIADESFRTGVRLGLEQLNTRDGFTVSRFEEPAK